MAQTKRKRQTKHRGNAAGVVESRGRTGRKPTAAEKSLSGREAAKAKEKLIDKRDQPPTWRGAVVRAMVAAVMFLLIVAVVLKQNSLYELFPVVLVAYIPMSYYTDKFVYERRQRKKAKEAAGKGTAKR
jgi:Flp pilus assembly protein TadB